MYGGLICIAFCLSVCHWTKTQETTKLMYHISTSKAAGIFPGVPFLQVYSVQFLQFAPRQLQVYKVLAGGLTSTSSCIFVLMHG